MAWIYLLLAGLFEVGFAAMLKPTAGFSKFWPSLTVIVLGCISLYFLAVAARDIPMGTAYLVWMASAPSVRPCSGFSPMTNQPTPCGSSLSPR